MYSVFSFVKLLQLNLNSSRILCPIDLVDDHYFTLKYPIAFLLADLNKTNPDKAELNKFNAKMRSQEAEVYSFLKNLQGKWSFLAYC